MSWVLFDLLFWKRTTKFTRIIWWLKRMNYMRDTNISHTHNRPIFKTHINKEVNNLRKIKAKERKRNESYTIKPHIFIATLRLSYPNNLLRNANKGIGNQFFCFCSGDFVCVCLRIGFVYLHDFDDKIVWTP